MAYANPARVRAQSIEAIQFSTLAAQYDVYGVPKTLIRIDKREHLVAIEGAVSEEVLIRTLREAIMR